MRFTNFLWLALLFMGLPNLVAAQSGHDTIVVQTFTFKDIHKRSGTFSFPNTGDSYEKILMVRTLKCDEATPHDKYPCGEWDYSTHTKVFVPLNDSVKEVFELDNFVTPYGKRLDLGDDGWTFVYDVTDYAPLLKGEVELSSGNTQELLDLKFLFIKGTPPRDVISVKNLYPWGKYNYGKLADEEVLKAFTLQLDPNAKGYMLRARISGHGHFGPRNCCEWDSKTHTYFGNDEVLFRWNVWKNCGDNPIYPQGGTWQFDRAGWCPGTPVDTYDFELTKKVHPGDSLKFDYSIEQYKENGEKGGEFVMSHQLFSYGAPNFNNDAAMMDIMAPSDRDEYSRINPICKDPLIIIRNTGKKTLRTLKISYGLSKGKKYEFTWNGKLEFMEKEVVMLPNISWKGLTKDPHFEVVVSEPNGMKDENPHNNMMTSTVAVPEKLPNKFFILVEANGLERAKENGYFLTNEAGVVLYERESLKDDEVYEDYVELPEGCYEFRFVDKAEDGMIRHWWNRHSNPDKVGRNGRIAIYDAKHNLIKELKYDFAEEEIFRFHVGSL